MRVLWASHSAGMAGAERCLLEGVKGLSSEDVSVHVVVPSFGRLVPALSSLQVPVSVIRYEWWMSPRGWKSFYYRARHFGLNLTSWLKILRLVLLILAVVALIALLIARAQGGGSTRSFA